MAIYVKSDPTAGQRTGDWKVTTNGGSLISRHRKKRNAVQKGRKEARKRNTNLKVQDTSGQWSQGPSY